MTTTAVSKALRRTEHMMPRNTYLYVVCALTEALHEADPAFVPSTFIDACGVTVSELNQFANRVIA